MNSLSIYEFDALISGSVPSDGLGVHNVPPVVFAWLESEALRITEIGEG